jgi:hypothetical protein
LSAPNLAELVNSKRFIITLARRLSLSLPHPSMIPFSAFFPQRIEKPFLDAVKTTLGDRYTDNVDVIYQTTIKFILDTLAEGFELGATNPELAKSYAAFSAAS